MSGSNKLTVYDRAGRPVAAKYLVDSQGAFIKNPVTGSPFIVPEDYNFSRAVSLGFSIQNAPDPISQSMMYFWFKRSGPEDLQRSYNGVTYDESDRFVEAFRGAASFHYGLVSTSAGYSEDTTMAFGGLYNLYSSFGNSNIDTSGPWWNNPYNSDAINSASSAFRSGRLFSGQQPASTPPRCFLAGTPILVADGTEKPIERVRVGDRVMAFNPTVDGGRSALIPCSVTRIFQNVAHTVIDLRGLRMTPGHVCLSGEGGFETVAAILRRDGTLVDRHGARVRARTGAAKRSPEDTPVTVVYEDLADPDHERAILVRAGIPCGALRQSEGSFRPVSLLEMLTGLGTALLPDGTLRGPDGEPADAVDWPPGSTPFATAAQRDWILRTGDGAAYVPDWIAELDEDGAALAANAGARPSGRH